MPCKALQDKANYGQLVHMARAAAPAASKAAPED